MHQMTSDTVFSISFFDPLPSIDPSNVGVPLIQRSIVVPLLSLISLPPLIHKLVMSRPLYLDLTCPNSYSKFDLELPKLRSQRHLKFHTSIPNSVILQPKILWSLDSPFPLQCHYPTQSSNQKYLQLTLCCIILHSFCYSSGMFLSSSLSSL